MINDGHVILKLRYILLFDRCLGHVRIDLLKCTNLKGKYHGVFDVLLKIMK